MVERKIKYSIIIPARNGARYLHACIKTVLSQRYDCYELIISNNHSKDDTESILRRVDHPYVRKIRPHVPLSMVDHFEWALSQALGEWLIFIGVDDGLQEYFFELAEKLTKYADMKNIRAIMSRRAYFFWPGCETLYGKSAVAFSAEGTLSIENAKWQAWRSLLGFQSYLELPQMYSNSLFKKGLITEAMKKQGRVFTSLTPDANLASIACSLEKKYLRSEIPLGWVGTSPASNGFSIAVSSQGLARSKGGKRAQSIATDFAMLNAKSKITYNRLAGNILLGSELILFWEALLQTAALRKTYVNKLIKAKIVKAIIFSQVLSEVRMSMNAQATSRLKMVRELMQRNRCSNSTILIVLKVLKYFRRFISVTHRLYQYIKEKWAFKRTATSICFDANWGDNPGMTLGDVSAKIAKLVNDTQLMEFLSSH